MLRIAIAQINLTVGDIEGNAARVRAGLEQARDSGAGIVLFPELTLTGYPPEDLLLKPSFAAASREALDGLAPLTRGLTAVVGFADRRDKLFNGAAVLHDGKLAGVYHKALLPNYAVFDERRYFARGSQRPLFRDSSGALFGVSICEDIWYADGPSSQQAAAGAEVLLNIGASPYQLGKSARRESMLASRAAENTAVVASCNLVGGQDELVFDGGSVIVDERGEVLARAAFFEEDFIVADVDVRRGRQGREDDRGPEPALEIVSLGSPPAGAPIGHPAARRLAPTLEPTREVYAALVLGTRDYVRKNDFEKVVLGLSGGVDSALVAAIAVDALGADNVVGVWMPSRYSTGRSEADAVVVARNLGIRLETIGIEPAHRAYREMLAGFLADDGSDATDENLQSRARGNVLMALSNRYGWLVLTTGNKSELAVGYTTIYGDMAGGFAVIKDVPKGWVYKLCRLRNRQGEVIPESVLTKPPTAELRSGQKDSDSLPDYDVLDPILAAYVEGDRGAAEIVALGHDEGTVRRVIRMVDRNEYKRRQAPPGPKVTSKSFGKDRRLPITNRYRSGSGLPPADS